MARFRTCDSDYSFEYTLVPTDGNSCSQDLNRTEGQEVIFDTRLQFGDQGDCQCIEEVTLLRLRRNYPNVDSEIVFICDERNQNCVNKSGYIVIRQSGQRLYDFSLVLPSANLNSGGRYYMEVEVKQPGQPGVSTVRRFWKIFQLTINPGRYGLQLIS